MFLSIYESFCFYRHKDMILRRILFFQDNQINITISKNGRDSFTINSRYINTIHLFVKERVAKGEIDVKYCPNYLMISDYFTKPLQGKMFKMFRDLIVGYVHINDLLQANELSVKERADKTKNVTVIQSLSTEKGIC